MDASGSSATSAPQEEAVADRRRRKTGAVESECEESIASSGWQAPRQSPWRVRLRLPFVQDSENLSAHSGFNLRGSPSNQPRTNRNGSLNAPRSCSGHHDPPLSIKRGSPSISALSGFNLRGSPSPSARLGFNLKRISLEIKPRTNRNGPLNAPRSRSGHRDPSITRGSPSISARSGFNLRGSPPPLPVGASNQRGSPSNLGLSGPRTQKNNRTISFDAKKQRIFSPQGSPLAQNASMAPPKPIERLSYLEFSQKTRQNASTAPRTEAPWSNLCGATRSPRSVSPRWVHPTP
jgi:hypothetical protein